MHRVTTKQGAAMLALTVIAGGVLSGASWEGLLGGLLVCLPVFALYAALVRALPGRSVGDMLRLCFGRLGSVLAVVYGAAGLLIVAWGLSLFTTFLKTMALLRTPMYVTCLALTLVCIYLAKQRAWAIGRLSAILIVGVTVSLAFIVLLSVGDMDAANLDVEPGVAPFARGKWAACAIVPFGFLCLSGLKNMEHGAKPQRAYLGGLVWGGTLLLAVGLTTALIIGGQMRELLTYPMFSAISIISVGGFLERIEVLAALTALLAVAVCLSAALHASSGLLSPDDRERIVPPAGLLCAALSLLLPELDIQIGDWLLWAAAALFVAVPLVMLIIARRGKVNR